MVDNFNPPSASFSARIAREQACEMRLVSSSLAIHTSASLIYSMNKSEAKIS